MRAFFSWVYGVHGDPRSAVFDSVRGTLYPPKNDILSQTSPVIISVCFPGHLWRASVRMAEFRIFLNADACITRHHGGYDEAR
jgi:hypothetical protein